MTKTDEFATFLSFYTTLIGSDVLTVAEKTAALEYAADEYHSRQQPAHFRSIVRRLADKSIRSPHAQNKRVAAPKV